MDAEGHTRGLRCQISLAEWGNPGPRAVGGLAVTTKWEPQSQAVDVTGQNPLISGTDVPH